MDNLTHTLTGLMMSRAGLDRYTPHAAVLLMLAANAPDVDCISWLGGSDIYFQYHRWYTHALLMIPLVAMLPVGLVALFRRKTLRLWPAYLLSIAGVVSHILLDSTDEYHVRLLLPFSDSWYGLDTTGVVDVWIWAILLGAVAVRAISSLVSSEIGARKPKGRGAAIAALFLLVVYDGARFFLHQRAVAVQEARLFEGAAPKRTAAIPSRLNPFEWIGIVDTGPAYHRTPINLLRDFDPNAGAVFYKPEQVPAWDAVQQTPPFRRLLNFTPFALLSTRPVNQEGLKTRVDAMDLRFGAPPDPAFIATALLTDKNEIARAWFHFQADQPR